MATVSVPLEFTILNTLSNNSTITSTNSLSSTTSTLSNENHHDIHYNEPIRSSPAGILTNTINNPSQTILHQTKYVTMPTSTVLRLQHIKKLIRITYPLIKQYTLYATNNQGLRIKASDIDAFESFIIQFLQVSIE